MEGEKPHIALEEILPETKVEEKPEDEDEKKLEKVSDGKSEEPVFIGPLPKPKRSKRQIAKHIMSNIYIILRQILEDFGSRIFLLLLVIAALKLGSGIGFIYITVTIILLVSESRSNWNHGWLSYALISFVIFAFQIYFVAAGELQEITKDTALWLGFGTNSDSVGVFLLNFFIFVGSILLGLFIHTKRIVMTDQEYIEAKIKYYPIMGKKARTLENPENKDILSCLVQQDESPEEIEKLKKEFEAIVLRYYYKKTMRFIERSYHKHGYELALFFLMVVALYNLNLISIVHAIIASYFSFSTIYFFEENKFSANLKWLQWKWRIIYFLLALDILRQFFFYLWFPVSWDIDRLFTDKDFSCEPTSKTIYSPIEMFSRVDDYRACISSWRIWLTLEVPSTQRLFIYIFTLYLMVLYDKYFRPYKQKRETYKEGDDFDFTNPNNRSFIHHLRFFYYCHFYLIPLVLFIGVGLRLNITGQTDLIGLIYFFLGLYLLLNYKKLVKEKNKTWKKIEILNIVIIILILIFQIPWIPCPIEDPGREFITLNECIWLQETYNTMHANTLNQINSAETWFAIVDIVGINKIARISFTNSYKEILMVIFFLMAVLQKKIWHHPYIKAYVTPYYEKKNRLNHQIAAKYIERVHLNRLMAHRGILLEKDLAIHTEKKIENKLMQWESMFDKFNVPMKENPEEEPIEEKRLVGEDELTEKCFRIIDEVTNQIPESRILRVTSYVQLVSRCNYNKEKVLGEIFQEIRKAKAEALQEIRMIRQLNLPKRMGKDLVLVDLKFVKNKDSVVPLLKEDEEVKPEEQKQDELKKEEGGQTPGFALKKMREENRQHEEQKKETEHEEEKKEDDEDYEVSVLPKLKSFKRSNHVKNLAVEEVLLEAQSPLSDRRRGTDQSESFSPIKNYEVNKDPNLGSDPQQTGKRTIIYKLNLWLIQQIRGSSLIGDVQARLLIGQNTIILIVKLFLVNMDKITFLAFVLNHLGNSNLLSMVYPLSALLYGALEYPTAPANYWKIMMLYNVILLIVKFLYQSPFICGTPPFSFKNIFNENNYDCENYFREGWLLEKRYDYIIGIHKFTGDSSYPQNQGIASGLFWDVTTFFCMILVRFTYDSAGIWNHLRIYNSFKYVPQLGDPFESEYNPSGHPTKKKFRFRIPFCCRKDEEEGHRRPKKKRRLPNPKNFLKNMFSFNPYSRGEATIRKPGENYYVYMAPLSLVILIYFIFFFSQMIGSSRSITEELSQSLFSGGVVIAILVIIIIMLFERIIYISRENIFKRAINTSNDHDTTIIDGNPNGARKRSILNRRFALKILMHFTLVLGVNGFFLYLMVRSLSIENSNNFAYIYIGYFLCSLYLYFSAQQIKFGFPLVIDTRVFQSLDPITVLLFKIYRAIPFLYEITSILDWTVTATSLELYQWMRVEDAYSNLYLIKNSMRGRRSHKIGQNRSKWERFTSGCILVFVLVFAIIFPILLFSTLNPTSELNNVISGSITIELQTATNNSNFRFIIYEVENLGIQSLSQDEFNSMEEINTALSTYNYQQVQRISIPTYSENQWLISFPSFDSLVSLLGDQLVTFYIVATWNFNRENTRDGQYGRGMNARILSEEDKVMLRDMLIVKQETPKKVVIESLIPKFLGITRLPFTNLLGPGELESDIPFNTAVVLTFVDDVRGIYWTLQNYGSVERNSTVFGSGNQINIIVASDQALASILSSFGSLGIVGFYVTITLAVGRIVRGMFDKNSQNVIYEELPVPDDLIELCDAIYMARKEGNHYKEEKLYNILVRVFRSPEMLIELTGAFPKNDEEKSQAVIKPFKVNP